MHAPPVYRLPHDEWTSTGSVCCGGGEAAREPGVEADFAAAITTIPAGPARSRGIAVGEAAAAVILSLRAGDGADTTLLDFHYAQGSAPGEYLFTPDRPLAFAPGWAEVTPFALDHAAQFRPGPPYTVTSKKYAADLNEVRALGGDGQTTPSARTPEQTQIAYFWLESSPLGPSRREDWQSHRQSLPESPAVAEAATPESASHTSWLAVAGVAQCRARLAPPRAAGLDDCDVDGRRGHDEGDCTPTVAWFLGWRL